MFKISTHIYSQLKDKKVVIKNLDLNERKRILHIVFQKYINLIPKSIWLWENFIHYEALHDDMAWSYIKEFVKDNECIMFFNQEEEKEMFLIQSGDDLNYILSETCGFEFYITDEQCSYLLCFSHHNILYGCGTAEEWINNMREFLVTA